MSFMHVRRVSFKAPPPAPAQPPVIEQWVRREPDIFAGSGSANLVTLHPVEIQPAIAAAEIAPGPQLPGHSTSELVANPIRVIAARAEVPPQHGALPSFAPRSRVQGML